MKSLIIAALATVVLAVPAVAGEIEVKPGTAEPKVTAIDPRGDPLGRIVIDNTRPAFGAVCVQPATGATYTFAVKGTDLAPGECKRLRAGKTYLGTWSSTGREVAFTVPDATPTARTAWYHKHRKSGERVRHVYRTPRGCITRTAWHAIAGGSWMSARDLDTGERHFLRRMAPDGTYKAPWRGYVVGTSCDTRTVELAE